MPTYQYEALDQTGKPQKGTLDATSSEDAVAKIKKQGYFPTVVREKKVKAKAQTKEKKKKGEFSFKIGGGVKTKVLVQFTRQLSTLQDAGLPILRSLTILVDQQKPGNFKRILTDVANEVEGGMSLSEAMSKHPRCFDRLYYKMIAAGEVGGVLDLILQRLADFMEKAQKLRARIKGAMIYPIAVISVAVLILTGIMIFIVPKFQEIFSDFDTELPLPTRVLIGTANWMVGGEEQLLPGWIVVLGSPFVFIFTTKVMKRSRAGKNIIDRFYMIVPVVGKLIKLSAIAKFTRTLGTLIGAGVPILEAILITRDTVGNFLYENALQKVHDAIREGESFAGPLREAKVCDPIVVNMIDVGEETGDLDKMLMKIADNYDEEVDNAVQALVSMLEPAMVVFLGGMVGFIVVALFLPLVKLIQSVSS